MRQTGLADLFKYRATVDVEPLENFTTTALAIAIRHDPLPFLKTLAKVADWRPASGTDPNAGHLDIDLDHVESVAVSTQVRLEARDGIPLGILDLVVLLTTGAQVRKAIWVEVKIDAGLGTRGSSAGNDADQAWVYMRHRAAQADSPFLVALTKGDPLRPDVPVIRWDEVVRQAAAAPDGHWSDLRVWLEESRTVPPPLPAVLGSWEDYLWVFKQANGELRRLWPDAPGGMGAVPRSTTRLLRLNVRDLGRIYQTAHCLSYGIRMGDAGPEWWVAIGDGSSYHRTRVPVDEVIEAARRGGLEGWTLLDGVYRADRFDIFEKRRPTSADPPSADNPRDVVDWLSAAFGEVKKSRVIEPYLKERRRRDQR